MALRPQTSAIDPQDLTDETLDQLLAVGHEDKKLDYKLRLDLSSSNPARQKDKVELAKDISAMSAAGGCIIIGADDQGQPTDAMNEVATAPFDQANLSNTMESLLEVPKLSSRVFSRNGCQLIAILIYPSEHGFCFCRTEGCYENARRNKVTVFEEGYAFWRDGTRSKRMNAEAIQEVLRRRITDAETIARSEHRKVTDDAVTSAVDALEDRLHARLEGLIRNGFEDLKGLLGIPAALGESTEGTVTPAQSPTPEVRDPAVQPEPVPALKAEPRLDVEDKSVEPKSPAPPLAPDATFLTSSPSDAGKAAIEYARMNDAIGFQVALEDARKQARALIAANDIEDGLSDLLDRLTCAAAAFLNYDGLEVWLDRVIASLSDIYSMPLAQGDADRFAYSTDIGSSEKAPRVWLEILRRVFALGGLAVRRERWDAVAKLTLQRPKNLTDYDKNWLRHGLTMSARAGHLKAGAENFITMAVSDTQRLECLLGSDAPDEDHLITSVARFDVLYNIVAVGDARDVNHGGVFYPSFAVYRGSRVQEVVQRLLEETGMRAVLFPLEDDDLAITLDGIGNRALSEGWASDGFTGWSPPITDFIKSHHP